MIDTKIPQHESQAKAALEEPRSLIDTSKMSSGQRAALELTEAARETTQQASFSKDAAAGADLVVTTEALRSTGVDIEVRRDGVAIASASGLHHPLLRPGPMLFSGGLRFGDKSKGLNDVLFTFTPTR